MSSGSPLLRSCTSSSLSALRSGSFWEKSARYSWEGGWRLLFTARPPVTRSRPWLKGHSHFRLFDALDDFVCCQVSIIIITRGGTASELTSLNRLAGINTSTCQYPGDRPSIVPDAQPLAQEAVIYLYFPTLGIDPKPLNNPR